MIPQNILSQIIQAQSLNIANKDISMIEALELFNIEEGILVTISQKDQFEKRGKLIHVIPAHEYLLK